MRKTSKAALASQLERQALPSLCLLHTIEDDMSLVQKMMGTDQTLSQLADSALTRILHEGVRSHRIDVVFDTHREYTIKNAESSNRGSTAGI